MIQIYRKTYNKFKRQKQPALRLPFKSITDYYRRNSTTSLFLEGAIRKINFDEA